MLDAFDLLGLPHQPWLDPEEVKHRFAELSAHVHPDHVHQASAEIRSNANTRYAELNQAAQTLSDAKLRLRHLIELETGELPSDIGQVPGHISDLFFDVGQLFRSADAIIREREQAGGPMVQAQLLRRAMEESEKLKVLIGKLDAALTELNNRCRKLNERWAPMETDRPFDDLTKLYRDYSYLTKWQHQAREKQLQLTL